MNPTTSHDTPTDFPTVLFLVAVAALEPASVTTKASTIFATTETSISFATKAKTNHEMSFNSARWAFKPTVDERMDSTDFFSGVSTLLEPGGTLSLSASKRHVRGLRQTAKLNGLDLQSATSSQSGTIVTLQFSKPETKEKPTTFLQRAWDGLQRALMCVYGLACTLSFLVVSRGSSDLHKHPKLEELVKETRTRVQAPQEREDDDSVGSAADAASECLEFSSSVDTDTASIDDSESLSSFESEDPAVCQQAECLPTCVASPIGRRITYTEDALRAIGKQMGATVAPTAWDRQAEFVKKPNAKDIVAVLTKLKTASPSITVPPVVQKPMVPPRVSQSPKAESQQTDPLAWRGVFGTKNAPQTTQKRSKTHKAFNTKANKKPTVCK